MSSDSNDYLKSFLGIVSGRLYTTVGILFLTVGSIGSVMGCIVFAQKSMRSNPSSAYFIAYNLANFFSLVYVLTTSVLLYFEIDPSYSNVTYCKTFYYFRMVSTSIPPYYLILAAIDRTLTTSANASLRQLSSHRLACWSLTCTTMILLLFWSHLLVFVDIYPIYAAYFLCYYPPGFYRVFASISGFVVNSSLVPLLLSIFTLLTVRNIRRGTNTVSSHDSTAANSRQIRNRQFTIMLLAEVAAYLPFNILWGIYSMYNDFTQYQVKSTDQQTMEYFLATFFYLLNFIAPTINFYLHLVVSKSFREKSAEIYLRACRRQMNDQVHNETGRMRTSSRRDIR